MYYDVSACEESEDIYEERIYQCLGEWEENDLHYIYTKRKDIGSFECFVGAKVGDANSEKIFLKEGGENCDRQVNPFKYGMEMNKICKYLKYFIIHAIISHLLNYSSLQHTTTYGDTITSHTSQSKARTKNYGTTSNSNPTNYYGRNTHNPT